MRLRLISEAGLNHSRKIVSDTAAILGDFIQFMYKSGKGKELNVLDSFLRKPSPQSWEQSKWIIDSIAQKTVQNPQLQPKVDGWLQLKNITSPIISTTVYSIEPKYLKGTPLQNLALSRQNRDKFKKALGPQGYVSTLANADELSHSELKNLVKATSKDSSGLRKAIETDMPNVKQIAKF